MEKVPEDPEFRSVFRIFPECVPENFRNNVPETGKYFENSVMYIVIPTVLQCYDYVKLFMS